MQVTYAIGTRTRTEEYEQLREVLYEEMGLVLPWRVNVRIRPVLGAPLSFEAAHNEVRWQLDVALDLDARPDVKQSFLLCVVDDDTARSSPYREASR